MLMCCLFDVYLDVNISCCTWGSWFHRSCLLEKKLNNSQWFCNLCRPIFTNPPYALSLTNGSNTDTDSTLHTVNNLASGIQNNQHLIFNPIDFKNDYRSILMDINLDADYNIYNELPCFTSTYRHFQYLNSYAQSLNLHTFGITHLNCRSIICTFPEINLLLLQTQTAILASRKLGWIKIWCPQYPFLALPLFTNPVDMVWERVGFLVGSDCRFEITEDEDIGSSLATIYSIQ